MLDPHAELTSLALYNVEPRALQFEDVLLLTAPHLSTIQVSDTDTAPIQFSSLLLHSPLNLRINGKQISAREFSTAEVLINPVQKTK